MKVEKEVRAKSNKVAKTKEELLKMRKDMMKPRSSRGSQNEKIETSTSEKPKRIPKTKEELAKIRKDMMKSSRTKRSNSV